MKFGKRQKGMGVSGWMLLILVFGGALSISLKLVPVYMDHNTIVKVLTKFADEDKMSSKGSGQLYDEIQRRLRVNNIREFNIKEHIEFDRNPDGVTMSLVYDVKVPLIHNLTLVADFNEQYRLR